MNVALLDVDSKIPNLALMKISAWHKEQGDSVEWYIPLLAAGYDRIYASKIFKYSDGSMLDYDRMIVGGTGSESSQTLPVEIENHQPDYELYGYEHSIGFAMRGCRLRCPFCVVPAKEGRPRSSWTIEEIWQNRDSKHIVLLDNDFFGNPDWPARIEEIQRLGLSVNFSQGLNIRNLHDDQAAALASVRFRNFHNTEKRVHFAWDDPRHEKLIHKGIRRAMDAGIKPSRMTFYVLIGYWSTPAEDLHRVEVLREYGCDPYVMPYDKFDRYQIDFARWVNIKVKFKTMTFPEYMKNQQGRHKDERTIQLFEVN
jgi:hypothetical protein